MEQEVLHERSARQAQTVRTVRTGSSSIVVALVVGALVIGIASLVAAVALVLLRRPDAAPVALAPAVEGELAFNRAAAAAALGSVDIRDCKTEGGPTGNGHVKVTFVTSGRVLTAEVDAPPFQGTAAGACIASRYQLVQIPPFGGSSVAVGKSFTLD